MPGTGVFIPDASSTHRLREALGRFATGVTVITTQSANGPEGFTANSFTSVSLDPPLVLWSPGKASSRHDIFVNAQYFCVHILGAEQVELCHRFGRGGAGFAGLQTAKSPEGTAVLEGCLARFECQRHAVHDAGDHTLILGRVLRCEMRHGAPLVFSQGGYGAFNPEL